MSNLPSFLMLKSCLLSLYTLKTIQKHTQKSMFLRYPRGKCCPTTLRCCCLKPCSLPVRKLCNLEDSSSGKHDKKSCPPSEVNIIRKMALTQFNLHYQNEGSRDVSLFASFIFIIHASFSCSYPCPYFWAKMFLAGQISRLALFVVFTMPFKIIVCHEYDYG